MRLRLHSPRARAGTAAFVAALGLVASSPACAADPGASTATTGPASAKPKATSPAASTSTPALPPVTTVPSKSVAASPPVVTDPHTGKPKLPTAAEYAAKLLPERGDVVSWQTLGKVTPKSAPDGRVIPVFSDEVLALDKKDVRVQGFMIPVEPDVKHRHFVISAVPSDCPFCMPAGPEAMVEVRTKEPIELNFKPVVVAGRLAVRDDDPRGVFYTLTEAEPVVTAP